jgi:RNA recognition motif-containing protein
MGLAFSFGGNRRERMPGMDVTLYVGNLERSVTETELLNLFSRVGEVTTIKIMTDRLTGKSNGYGFLTMSCQSEADHAVSRFNNFLLGNLILEVGLVRPRSETGQIR